MSAQPCQEHRCLTDVVARYAATIPGTAAVIHANERISYAELWTDVLRMAQWLRNSGVRAGDLAGITVRHEYNHLLVSLALIELGCSQACLATSDPISARILTARRLKVRWHVVEGDSAVVPDAGAIVLDPPAVVATAIPEGRCDIPVAAREESLVIFASSGSTGKPKLMPFRQRNLLARRYERSVPPRVVLVLSSIENNAPKGRAFIDLLFGATTVLSSTLRNSDILQTCARHAVTEIQMFTHSAEALLVQAEALPGPFPVLDHIRIDLAGSTVSPSLFARCIRVLSSQTNIRYGSTEVGTATVASAVDRTADEDSVGPPLPGVELQIVSPADQVLPAGTPGIIRMRTPMMVQSYFDDEIANRRHFRDGWFYPGDEGVVSSDGRLAFLGRSNDLMILGGTNVFAAEIEEVAKLFPGVNEAVAFAVRSPAYGDIPILAIADSDGVTEAALLAFCREQLGLRAPKQVVRLASIPRTEMGKPKRNELSADFERRLASNPSRPTRP